MEIPPLPSTSFDKPIDLFDKYRWPILGVLSVILAVGIYLAVTPPPIRLGDEANVMLAGEENTPPAEGQVAGDSISGDLVIDVAGAVAKPGVYRLAGGSIVEDAINAAGGFARIADLDAVAKQINRAELLNDHVKVYIPKKGDTMIVATSTTDSLPTGPIAGNQAKINLNTASNTELELLPTIGPVMAQRIVDYRIQNNGFKSIDEIKNVNGISDAKFAQLRDLITI
jgi:competence protein ComEA